MGGRALIDVILADSTLLKCGNNEYIRHCAGGVLLALAQKGMDVRCVDLMLPQEEYSSAPPVENPPAPSVEDLADVCCYVIFYGNKIEALRHMTLARRANKAPRLIIAFGPFASVFSEEILFRGLADIVVTSDPEFVIPMVLGEENVPSSLSAIPNLSYKHEGKVVHTPKHSFQNFDKIPFISQYFYKRGHRPAFIMTSRGCAAHCTFCDRHVFTSWEVIDRSVDNVLSEIKELVEFHHVKHINVLDADIAFDHKRLIALCTGMRRIKGEFSWNCMARVDSVNQKLLLLMKSARCWNIFYGVESASPQVLRRLGKTYGRQEIVDALRWTQEAGMMAKVGVMIGNPGETDFDRNLTLSAVGQLGPQVTFQTTRLAILPGTALYHKGLREGWFTRKSYFEEDSIIYYDEKKQAVI